MGAVTDLDVKTDTRASSWEKIAAVSLGSAFLITLLVIALFVPTPTEFQILVFRVTLALAAGGVGAVLPGIITVAVSTYIRAGGALALFAAVFWFNPPQLVTESTPFDDAKQRAEAGLAAGNYTLATTFFEKAKQARPGHWAPYYGLGRTEFERGNWANSLSDFQQAFELTQPKDGSILFAEAMTQDALGRYDDARVTLAGAAKLLPTNSPLAMDVLYDQGLAELLSWLQHESPSDSPRYRAADLTFRKFIEGNGSPKQWAYYHMACLYGTRAQDRTLSAAEVRELQSEGNRMLESAVEALRKSNSTKASFQLDLLRRLLSQPSTHVRQPGEPANCPAVASSWIADRGPIEALLSKLAG